MFSSLALSGTANRSVGGTLGTEKESVVIMNYTMSLGLLTILKCLYSDWIRKWSNIYCEC